MIYVGYVRVSTGKQAEEGVSIPSQIARINGWCESRDTPCEAPKIFSDAGISGKRIDTRHGLKNALNAACVAGGVLVVYSFSRLARSTKDAIAIAERLEQAGADLVSLTEQIDTTSAAGKMFFRLLAVFAEFERDIGSERTKAGLDHKRSRHERIGQIPYGVRLAEDGISLVEDFDDTAAILKAKIMREGGRSFREIAAVFDAMGLRPKNGGANWSASTIRRLTKRDA